MQREQAILTIKKLQSLAQGSKWHRFRYRPLRYIQAQITYRLLFPLLKRGFWAQTRTFFGSPLRLLLPAGTDLYLFGAKTHDSELRLSLFWMKNIPAQATVLDVGAHFGYYSQLASVLVGEQGQVIALEASQVVFEVLQLNAKNENIRTVHAAAGAKMDSITFYEFPIFYSEYNTLHPEQYQGNSWFRTMRPTPINTPQLALGDWLQQEGLSPQWIKIDVEGAEWEVIQGLETYLKKEAVTLSMEYIPQADQTSSYRQAYQQLLAWDYQCFWINTEGEPTPCMDPDVFLLQKGLDSDNLLFRRRFA